MTPTSWSDVEVAVLIPCLNEAPTIGEVVREAKEAIPHCVVVVGDNDSTDDTARLALEAGAAVLRVDAPGKGRVMARLFSSVEADVYVMVDGDGTYDLAGLPEALDQVSAAAVDMVVGVRLPTGGGEEFRPGHRLGNLVLTRLFRGLFGLPITDTLSGYRVMSRRFVKSLPSSGDGFEWETDLNVHAANLRCAVGEQPVNYRQRPLGSDSKLRTYSDGWRIFRRNVALYKEARPRQAFGILAVPWLLATLILVGVPVREFFESGQVMRFPSLVVGVGCFIVAALLLQAGLVIARTASVRREIVQLAFLGQVSPWRTMQMAEAQTKSRNER